MRGSTRKRGSTWTAYWDLPADAETGSRKQASKGGFRTQKEAQRHLASVVVQVGEGTYIEPSRQPLARFMSEEWLPGIGGTLRPLSRSRYAAVTRSYITRRDIGGVPLRGLTGAHLNALYAELEREGLSVATRRLVHAVLRTALNDAVRWGKIARNPAAAADPPALPRSHAQAWTAGELRRFLGHVADDRLFALWRLAATTGMRRGELLGLAWHALDLEGARLRVDQQLVPTTGGVTFGPPKSRRSERTIALDAATLDALRHHRAVQVLSGISQASRTKITTSFSATRSDGPSTLSGSRRHSPSTARRRGSRPAHCTSCDTRARRWRLQPRRRCRCTSSLAGSGTIQRPSLARTRTCCRTPMRWPPMRSPRRSWTSR
jgi:integrase